MAKGCSRRKPLPLGQFQALTGHYIPEEKGAKREIRRSTKCASFFALTNRLLLKLNFSYLTSSVLWINATFSRLKSRYSVPFQALAIHLLGDTGHHPLRQQRRLPLPVRLAHPAQGIGPV